MKPDRWDPLDPAQAHAPADGSEGVAVGDDTGKLPRVRLRRCWPWGRLLVLVVATVVLMALAIAALLAAPVAGTVPDRQPPVCRCGSRAT